MTASFSLSFGGFVLEGCHQVDGDSAYRATKHIFPRRPGSIRPRVPTKDETRVDLEGEIWKDSRTQIKAYFKLLGKQLDAGRNRLILDEDGEFLNAVVERFHWGYAASRSPATVAKYSLSFVADDPYWYAPQHSEQTESIGAVNIDTFAVTNNGDARTPAVIQITRTDPANDQANITLTHTTSGLFMTWAGSLPDGQSIIFDSVNQRVTALGGNGLTAFSGTIRIELEPGLNNFEYVGPGNVDIVIAWQERFGQS